MKYRSDLPIFFLLLLSINLYPQYSRNDTDLIKTTISREYDRKIVLSYLHSGDENKINAALLSIANSVDTSFIPELLSPVIKYKTKSNLYFTLSLLGESKLSEKFLKNELHNSSDCNESQRILNTLGSTSDSSFFQQILADPPSCGVSEALLNFHIRGIRSTLSASIVKKELMSGDDNLALPALFAINRMGLTAKLYEEVKSVFQSEISKGNFNSEKVYYCLMAFRRVRKSPLSPDEIAKLFPKFEFNQLVEFARVIPFANYQANKDLKPLFMLLKHKNPNVAISMAAAMTELRLENSGLKNFVYNEALTLIASPSSDEQVKGNLFLSLCTLFPDSAAKLRNNYKHSIPSKLFFRSYSISEIVRSDELASLIADYDKHDDASAIEIAGALAGSRSVWEKVYNYDNALFKLFSAPFSPAFLATLCEKIDTQFVLKNSEALAKILIGYIENNLNNYEASLAYPNILRVLEICCNESAEKAKQIINSSDVLSLAGVLPRKAGQKAERIKDTGRFPALLTKSFYYKEAEIATNKGAIRFRLLPDYAPLTVGNFIKLSEEGFFDGVIFHRVVPGFVIQSGDTANTGWYGPGYQIVSEFSWLRYETGTAGIASNGPDTEGSQWFFMHKDFPHLNGRYTVFGELIEGIDVIRNITESDRVLSVRFK